MADEVVLSEREILLAEEIKEIYNSGDCKLAMEKSFEFLREFPNSYMARYEYAVTTGDYSYSVELSEEERIKYRTIGNNGIKSLAEDPEFKRWPPAFQSRVRNEYYWFFEMPKEQYELGLERIARGEPGHYSASVGASMMALKCLKENNITLAEEWAQKSLMHFKKFEEYAPHWHNINFFAAQATACLGNYQKALLIYLDMFRKQNAPEDEAQVADFRKKVDEIRTLRGDL